MQNAIQELEIEFSKLQVGRPSPALIQQAPITTNPSSATSSSIGSIARVWVKDASTLRIEVAESSAVRAVEGAISNLKLGILPNKLDKNVLELRWEKPTAESREALANLIAPLAERFKSRIRIIRKDALKLQLEGQSKDFTKQHQEQVQKMHDNALERITLLAANKKRSLLQRNEHQQPK